MWLKHLFNLRDKTARTRGAMSNDEEKPFLSHLEDLRSAVVRVVVTLLVSMIVCFIFHEKLFKLMQKPGEIAGIIVTEVPLPDGFEQEDWDELRKLSKASLGLSAAQRTALLNAAFEERNKWSKEADMDLLRRVAAVHRVHSAAELLSQESREAFVNEALIDPNLRETVKLLVEAETPGNLEGNGSSIQMQALAPTETFKLSIKLSLFAGVVIAFPLLFYFIAQFVFPGLTDKEKKLLWPSLATGFGLFLMGVLFAYRFVAVQALIFFHEFSQNLGVVDAWKIGEYVSFVTQLVLIFGLCFELPVVVMALVKLELLSHELMRRTRSYAIVVILVVAAIITPTPDAFVLSLLAGPLIILYEICIWLAWFLERRRPKEEQEEKPASIAPAAGTTAAAGTPYEEHEHDHDSYHDEHHGHDDPYDHGHDGFYDDYYRDQDDSATEDTADSDDGETEKPSGESSPNESDESPGADLSTPPKSEESEESETENEPGGAPDPPESPVGSDGSGEGDSDVETDKGEDENPDDSP
jgi:sec-independent protein translocase protein TatC